MLASNIYRNLCRIRQRHIGGSIAHLSGFFNGSKSTCREHDSRRFLEKPIFPHCRRYTTATNVQLPPLFDHPPILWPAMLKTLRNLYYINIVMSQQYDPEFSIEEFTKASKQALLVVANALARENYDFLDGLVTPDVIQSLREKISALSDQQKEMIAVQDEDVYMTFPYEVEIKQEGDEGRERTFVEITIVHHILRGLTRMKAAGVTPPINIGMDPEYKDRLMVANYRFIREYTKGIESSWIVNMVNHFQLSAL